MVNLMGFGSTYPIRAASERNLSFSSREAPLRKVCKSSKYKITLQRVKQYFPQQLSNTVCDNVVRVQALHYGTSPGSTNYPKYSIYQCPESGVAIIVILSAGVAWK